MIPSIQSLSPTWAFAISVLLVGLALLYRAILPKPIRGIPYKQGSEKRLLGDATEVSLCLPLQKTSPTSY
jgi:hypothetical protein